MGSGHGSGRTIGVAVGVGLIASLAAVFAVSQGRPSLLSPPWYDWFAGWLPIGDACVAAVVIDRGVHACDGGVRTGTAAPNVRLGQVRGGAAAFVTLALAVVCCGVFVVVVEENDGVLRFAARDSEVLPLPPNLRLVSVDQCAGGGRSGNCTAQFVVIAADGASRAVTVTRLVEHLRGHGWALGRVSFLFRLSGRRRNPALDTALPFAGSRRRPQPNPSGRPEAAIVYIDNTG